MTALLARIKDRLKHLGCPSLPQSIAFGITLLLAVAGFFFVRGFVACWRLTALPGKPLPSCSQESLIVYNPEGTPMAVTATPSISIPDMEMPPPWDGASRVTLLLIGLDYRDWEEGLGAPRSDTMILFTLDPLTHTAGILSVPRDLWVNIPGFGYSKLNNAYAFGQAALLPGGGPGLAIKTVENFLGINIDYYAQVDFGAFEKMVDTIGGVCLDIPEPITVGRTYENSAHLEAGYQCLDGKSTLGYARARYTAGGDIDRAARQQQVIRALMDKVFDPAAFPSLVAQSPALYAQLSEGIKTDLSLTDALRLAVLVKDLPRENIRWATIDYTMADIGSLVVDGMEVSIMRPFPDQIRDLVDTIFSNEAYRPAAVGDVRERMQAEGARVVIVNGSGREGLAARTAEYLTAEGMKVVGYGNVGDYPALYQYPFPDRTVIIFRGEGLYAMLYLKELMGFNTPSQIIFDLDPTLEYDLIVALGYDWGYSNPLP